MNESIFRFVASRSEYDQPLTDAARVALEADPTPRMIKFIVGHDGKPIEKPDDKPVP